MDYDEGKENRKLLYLALKGFYGAKRAAELMHENNEKLFGFHELAWAIGKRSISFFCRYFLQDTFTPKPGNVARKLAPMHYELWEEAENIFIKDKYDKFAAAEPRGSAKTTILDFAITTWLHAYEISPYTLVCGKVEQDATDFIATSRQAFEENQYVIKAFGKLIDTRNYTVNKLELELANHTKIQAISSTSSIRGKKYKNDRPFCIIADDYQGKSDIITFESREKKYRTWQDDAKYAGDEAVYRDGIKIKMATKFIVLGTILHRDCFMSRILKNKEYKCIVRKAVLVDDVDKLYTTGLWEKFKRIYFSDIYDDSKAAALEFYYQHESEMQYPISWPDKWSCAKLAIDYYTDEIGFKQELQNDASKIGVKSFKSIITQTPEQIEDHTFIKTMLCMDPAGTDNKNKKNEDFYGFLVGSLGDNNFKYVRKGEILKIEYEEYVKHTLELLIKYEEITHICIEKNTYMGADVVKIKELVALDEDLKLRDFTYINEMQQKNKDEKINTSVSDVNNGRIIFNSEDVPFQNQIMDFAGQAYSEHDDAPDINAEFNNRINDILVVQNAKPFDRHKLM
ncbi:hypothetical protein LGL08_19995 [Clostridium estertheticum]|uniref:hypothetical protein n=1 Tax=Clostridium estertheticum TaxID=238834 RepID=UPI001CF5CD1C|nr:hypothetical protein [Clostridium estertheticum]MCB2308987.1 hypothetical protein [Clostridium estertheticum]MCB2346879.1 hypothetical protein [Clostridium estertheticum]MCB2351809.1 hypothetical protein [Clostridium estertheticum]WAG48413.1 hypothetical protein LL127_22800 [Clostridium estertheticum]